MQGRLFGCAILYYRTPADSLKKILPPGLSLLTHNNWAFWSIVACRVDELRPGFLPSFMGIRYNQIAYRLMVTAKTKTEGEIKGLYFVRTDVNHIHAAKMGNFFSDFNYHQSKITFFRNNSSVTCDVIGQVGAPGNAKISLSYSNEWFQPKDSCFSSGQEAASFFGVPPSNLVPMPDGKTLSVARAIPDNEKWTPQPVTVHEASFAYLNHLKQTQTVLESALYVNQVRYNWEFGGKLPLA